MDLHPEELLEGAVDELPPADRTRLDAHLRQCPACRLELRARIDFRRQGDGPEPDVRALIANSLVPLPRVRVAARIRRLRFALVAAALLGLGGLAAAASAWPQWWGASPGPNEPAAAVFAHVAGPKAPVAAPPPAAPSDPPTPADARDLPAPMSARRSGLGYASTGAQPAPPATIAEEAANLFDHANAARRQGDHDGAAATYRRLIARHPRSDEAHESLVVLGRMLLDDGDPESALPYFETYVNRGGVLAAEAMLGRALALQHLGRTSEERSAWTALVDAYPDSVHAERARARLAELRR
jgi:TolA-binding protein